MIARVLWRSPEQKATEAGVAGAAIRRVVIRPFEAADADGVAQLIATTARSSSSGYPRSRVDLLVGYFTPARLRRLATGRYCLVALDDERIIGTGALEAHILVTFFVHPDHQRRGVGRRLLDELEAFARRAGYERIAVDASAAIVSFYERRGYRRTGAVFDGAAGPQICLEKRLHD